MEQIQNVSHSQSVGYHIILRVPLYLRVVFMLLTGFTIANIGVQTLALTAAAPFNPFTAYADIFPGQPANAIERRTFSCSNDINYHHSPAGLSCSFTLAEGAFSRITVIISGGIIRYVSFEIRQNNFSVGDLQIFLGVPIIHKYLRMAYFALPDSYVTAQTSGYTGQLSLFLPVLSVSFNQLGFSS